MVLGRFARGDSATITIDRAVAAIAVAALVLAVIIGVRAGIDRFSGVNLSTLAGVRLLAPSDVLVTFEDFELGAPGWESGRHDQSTNGFGGMLGRFGGTEGREAVSRTYSNPETRAFTLISFDMHAIDDWALDDIIVFANGVEVLRQNFTTRPDQVELQRSLRADLPWIETDLSLAPRSGLERGFGRGNEALLDQTMHVEMIISGRSEELRLGFGSTLAGDGVEPGSWAIDNLQIVMTNRLPRN